MAQAMPNQNQGEMLANQRQQPDPTAGGAALVEVAEAYLSSLDGSALLSKATKRAYRTDLGQFMAFAASIGIDDHGDIRGYHVDDWVATLAGQQPATIRRKLVAVSQFFEWALKRELVRTNPVGMATKPRKRRTVQSAVSVDHYGRLLAACRTTCERARLACLFWGGLRRQELADLDIGHVDLQQMSIFVRGKSENERLVPIVPNLGEIMREYLTSRPTASFGDPLFLSRDGVRMTPRVVNRWFRGLCKRADLAEYGYTPHSCRRGMASLLHAQGCSPFEIMTFLGHSDPKTTFGYIQGTSETLRAKLAANEVFGQEGADEAYSSADLRAVGAKMSRMEDMLALLLERSSLGLQDGVYPLHEAPQFGGGVRHHRHAVAHGEPPQ